MHPLITLSQVGCLAIEPANRLSLYLDGWLNACVAIQRAIALARGVNFGKKTCKHVARWVILFLPLMIASSIIHEPLHRELFNDKQIHMAWCVTCYFNVVLYYNIFILLLYFLVATVANLFCAIFIIFRTIRRRSRIQRKHTFRGQIRRQLRDHERIQISPTILVLLSRPCLITYLLS
jgi:hypothetical protein